MTTHAKALEMAKDLQKQLPKDRWNDHACIEHIIDYLESPSPPNAGERKLYEPVPTEELLSYEKTPEDWLFVQGSQIVDCIYLRPVSVPGEEREQEFGLIQCRKCNGTGCDDCNGWGKINMPYEINTIPAASPSQKEVAVREGNDKNKNT